MSEVDYERINLSNIFLSDMQPIFLPSNYDNISHELLNESKEAPLKQHIKFISVKQDSPSVSLLQKKTNPKNDNYNMGIDNSNNGRWSKEEQNLFAEAVLKYGNDWKNIQNHVSSRNITQVRSHAQKFLMKLKESNLLKERGLEQNLSWTKIMNFLKNNLTYDELKDVLFSVEQTGQKKNRNESSKSNKNKNKINKNNNKNSSIDENNSKIINGVDEENNNYNYGNNYLNIDFEEDNYNIKNKMIKEEEEEKEMLQKFIECFNSSSSEITLNSSFEENSRKDCANDAEYNFLIESPIKYRNTSDFI